MSLLAIRVLYGTSILLLLSLPSAAITKKPVKHKARVHKTSVTIAPVVNTTAKKVTVRPAKGKYLGGPWRVPTYADSTEGDRIEGEDPTVRRAALDALGKLNGTVVVADPQTGRILSIVNQRLAFRDGFQPCSTVKVPVALAALSESDCRTRHAHPHLRPHHHDADRGAG